MYQELDGWQTVQGAICLKSAKKQGMGQIEEYQNLELQTAISHCAQLRVAVDIKTHINITTFFTFYWKLVATHEQNLKFYYFFFSREFLLLYLNDH